MTALLDHAESKLALFLNPAMPLAPLDERDLGDMFRVVGQRWAAVIGAELRAAQTVKDMALVSEIQATISKLTKVDSHSAFIIFYSSFVSRPILRHPVRHFQRSHDCLAPSDWPPL